MASSGQYFQAFHLFFVLIIVLIFIEKQQEVIQHPNRFSQKLFLKHLIPYLQSAIIE